jgi:hypothetical protein
MGVNEAMKTGIDDLDARGRLEAVAEISDQARLAYVARTDPSLDVCRAALDRLTTDERLAEVARDARDMGVRLAAVERIGSDEVLEGIIRERGNLRLVRACLGRITDRAVLERIAADTAFAPATRRLAVEHFADESFLSDVLDDGDDETRKSEAAIERILEAYEGPRVVRAIGRFRYSEKALRALGTIAHKGGECGVLATEYLCRALGSSSPELRRAAHEELVELVDPEEVEVIVGALDEPAVAGAVRAVLEAIDTPEARRGLASGQPRRED